MNASDDEVFEDTVETVEVIENPRSKAGETTAIMSPKPKSAAKSMTSYKGFWMKRINDVNDAVTLCEN